MIAYDRLRLTKYSAPDDTRFGLQAFSNLLLLLVVTATFASGQTKPSFFGRGKLNKYIFQLPTCLPNAHCNLLIGNRIDCNE